MKYWSLEPTVQLAMLPGTVGKVVRVDSAVVVMGENIPFIQPRGLSRAGRAPRLNGSDAVNKPARIEDALRIEFRLDFMHEPGIVRRRSPYRERRLPVARAATHDDAALPFAGALAPCS